jgi:AAA+ ATPase superfamily predicted ATPase
VFQSSVPVLADAFLDRTRELARLKDILSKLQAGAPTWVCLLGPRKVGKTSLLLELARQASSPPVHFVVTDVFERMPPSVELLRTSAIRAVDAALGPGLGVSFEALSERPEEYRSALVQSPALDRIPPDTRAVLMELPDRQMDARHLRACIDLPERLAQALGLFFVVAIDEFQELASRLAGPKNVDLMPLLRSAWQRHRRVAYAISGSEPTMLKSLVTSEHSPFFQHFSILEIGPFDRRHGVQLLVEQAPRDRPIPPDLAEHAVDVVGGHPFYLQLLGEALTSGPPPYDLPELKAALQSVLFSRTGRLALYFENEYSRLVGRSTFLAAVLDAVADGPVRLVDVAGKIRAPAGATSGYIERLGDAIIAEDRRYRLADPTFALWLRWRKPGGTVVPMRTLGDEAEKAVADHLARSGFELVYQSRGSRGAFDLLALRGVHRLGVQVKRADLPVRIPSSDWARMDVDGDHHCSRWLVMVVSEGAGVLALDPAKARRTPRGVSLGEDAVVHNLLLWLEEDQKQARKKPPAAPARRSRKKGL